MSGEVYNVFFWNTSFIFEQTSRRMFSSISALKNCDISAGSCSDQKYVLMWDFDKNFFCPTLVESMTNTSSKFRVDLHLNDKKEVSYIDLPSMALSFHHSVECSSFTKHCLHENRVLCLPNGMVLDLQACGETDHFFELRSVKEMLHHYNFSNNYNGETLNFINDFVGSVLQKQEQSMNFIDCKIERSMATMLRLFAKTYPSEILSLLLNDTVGAVSMGDTLGLLNCV